MIIASAIKLMNGQIFVGKRHNNCYENIRDIYLKIGKEVEDIKKLCIDSEQGFINDKLQFMTRGEAYYEAYTSKQCRIQEWKPSKLKGLETSKEDWHPCLTSEDLW